ncbi:MAG: hypothetical protein ACI4Q4_01965, partial [Oscillospiraceae bacterium]
ISTSLLAVEFTLRIYDFFEEIIEPLIFPRQSRANLTKTNQTPCCDLLTFRLRCAIIKVMIYTFGAAKLTRRAGTASKQKRNKKGQQHD